MIEQLNIQAKESILSEDKAGTFMTSLDVIQKVMNVPMCALTSLLRANVYDNIDDTSSLCIDEERLEIFAEAYVRKIRSYFLGSLRNISNLTSKELSNFKQFNELFKNKDLQREPSKWSDIDVEHLIEAFKEKVKKETPKLSAYDSLFEHVVVSRITKSLKEIKGYFDISKISDILLSITPIYKWNSNNENFKVEEQTLEEIVHSYYYVAKSTYVKQKWHINFLIRNIYIAARYHIYSSDSDDEFYNETLAIA